MRWMPGDESRGFGKCRSTYPRPWLVIERMPYSGSMPMRMQCMVCEVKYRNQGISTAARFMRTHRRCGFIGS